MRTTFRHLLRLAAITGFLTACGDSGLPGAMTNMDPGLGDTTPNPSDTLNMTIISPPNSATVKLPPLMHIAVKFDANYTLKAPGMCAGQPNCGHIYVLVDDASCNVPGKQYNSVASTSPAQANMGRCMMATGMHTITLALRHDDSSPVNDMSGNPITAKTTITVQ
jgi:predicted small lipoprotein YifL